MFTLNDLFDIAIKMEENGRDVYLDALGQTSNKEIENLVKWMADEENRHKSWFEKQKDSLSASSRDLDVMLPGVSECSPTESKIQKGLLSGRSLKRIHPDTQYV